MNFFLCPKCGYPQYCGCRNCRDLIPKGIMAPISKITGEDTETCANCGFTEEIGWWIDYTWDMAIEAGRLDKPFDYPFYVFSDWDGIEINYI